MGFQLRLDENTDIKITKIAKLEGRSKNKEIEHIIKEYIKTFEEVNGEISCEEVE